MKFHGVNVVSLSIRLRGMPGRSSKGYRGVRLHCITSGEVRLCCATPGQASFAETSLTRYARGSALCPQPSAAPSPVASALSVRRSLVEHRRVELLIRLGGFIKGGTAR